MKIALLDTNLLLALTWPNFSPDAVRPQDAAAFAAGTGRVEIIRS